MTESGLSRWTTRGSKVLVGRAQIRDFERRWIYRLGPNFA
jgi:hypothetical protein